VEVADATRAGVSPEDLSRAHLYRLLGRLLAAPPDGALLDLAAGLVGDDGEIGRALEALAARAAATTPEAASREYHELFIGIGRGELVPYASFYLTGFLHERPLARLRGDMARLGIARAEEVREPEDHVAALCEMMAGLIDGAFGEPLGLDGQKRFFDAHLEPWAGRFFEDLEKAQAAAFYVPVGTIGRALVSIERAAFDMI
jgi:TorA maturation chaperone TorD